MLASGDNVRVLPPFDFSENVYTVLNSVVTADGQDVYILQELEGGFSIDYLRKVD